MRLPRGASPPIPSRSKAVFISHTLFVGRLCGLMYATALLTRVSPVQIADLKVSKLKGKVAGRHAKSIWETEFLD